MAAPSALSVRGAAFLALLLSAGAAPLLGAQASRDQRGVGGAPAASRALAAEAASPASSVAGGVGSVRTTDGRIAPTDTAFRDSTVRVALRQDGVPSLTGRSGKVRFAPVSPNVLTQRGVARLFEASDSLAAAAPVAHVVLADAPAPEPLDPGDQERDAAVSPNPSLFGRVIGVIDLLTGHRVRLLAMYPFSAKHNGHIGSYRLGFWPAEHRGARSEAYDNPAGFIEVTRETLDMPVSEHFQLGDFVTHDQDDVWPKYVVLRPDLIDKLELTLEELERAGVRAGHAFVMSGFRHPSYNAGLVGGGAAKDSRHQFGDAADVIIDDDRDGRMDDLNGDGRLSQADVEVVLAAVNRVEQRFPDLVGGVGTYRATGQHGPFAHIDVRGTRARWTTFGQRIASRRSSRARCRASATRRCPSSTVASRKKQRASGGRRATAATLPTRKKRTVTGATAKASGMTRAARATSKTAASRSAKTVAATKATRRNRTG